MEKLSVNMVKNIQEMLKNSRDLNISSISPINSDKELTRFTSDFKQLVSKNRNKTITVIISVN